LKRLLGLFLLASFVLVAPAQAAKMALFDNAHAETAGNADWQIDTHQPIPSPAQSGIGANTPGTFWVGAISSFGVDLVKRGYTVETNTGAITYGNAGNPQDLSNFDVFIVPEPNTLFSAAEVTAILNYVHDGGGLLAISDHSGSDRNNDGSDSPVIWNAVDPTHALWGVHFGVSTDANNNITQTSTNVAPSASDSITHGPVGTVTGLAFHNGTTLTLYPSSNPSVRGEVWMTGLSQTSTTGVMAASCRYGSGRVFFVCDSSPVDYGSASPGNSSIFDGWGEAGATDSTLFLNAALWASRRSGGDVQLPTVTLSSPHGGEDWKAGSSHAITWTASDNVGVTSVDLAYSTDGGASFPNVIASGPNSGGFVWTVPNAPGTALRVRAIAHDAAGNLGSDSSATNFTIDLWTITASAGANGSISPSGAVGVVEGASQGFTITPAAHYHVADVLADGGSVGAVSSWNFPSVNANHTIAASFAIDTFGLTVGVVGNGTVQKNPDQASYPQGSSVQLTAIPGPGWSFTAWSGDTSTTANPILLAMNGARSVTASFADTTPPTVTVTSPNGGERWAAGSSQSVTWSAADNAVVDSVDIDYAVEGGDGEWLPIAHGLTNSGSYAWTVPASPTSPADAMLSLRVTARDPAGNAASDTSDAAFTIVDPTTGVANGPAVLALARPIPNPSTGATLLAFSLPRAARARIDVIDASGRRVATCAGEFGPGDHTWRWSGAHVDGSRVGAGLYFVRLSSPFGTRLQRLVRLD